MKIISVVGARPNFMKIAPFIKAINTFNSRLAANSSQHITHFLVHTGQHYDDRMSQTFFDELDISQADINLEIGSGSHAEQVGQTMMAFEKVCLKENPDWVVVVGDVNATLACSVSAKKLNIKVCHIEAGLRSGDMSMPEEINRLVTDRLSDLLLTPDKLSGENLRIEGVPKEKIKFIGNIMIDTLEANRAKAEKRSITDIVQNNFLQKNIPKSPVPDGENFCIVTLHRPSNVDSLHVLHSILQFIMKEVTRELIVVWPLHPRTKKQLKQFKLFEELNSHNRIFLLEPLGYLDMLRLNMGAKIMFTDSGGLQEECTVIGTPCLTLRWNTERPVTLREHGGASVLVGNNITRIREEYKNTLSLNRGAVKPEFWDGKTAERCVEAIIEANK
jgi:UDP-N-acetylglucosamine 2-epimerase (non-hydrolysing)